MVTSIRLADIDGKGANQLVLSLVAAKDLLKLGDAKSKHHHLRTQSAREKGHGKETIGKRRDEPPLHARHGAALSLPAGLLKRNVPRSLTTAPTKYASISFRRGGAHRHDETRWTPNVEPYQGSKFIQNPSPPPGQNLP